jgi:23S rRNA (pseudouridine1915-N3)-methyltransferase
VKFLIVAVGERMPRWVEEGFAEYAKRFPRKARVELIEIRSERRSHTRTVQQLLAGEAKRIEGAIPPGCKKVVLDERGSELTTTGLARRAAVWLAEGRDIAFLVGGPDGLAPAIKDTAEFSFRLSALTLPHGLARVLLAEQLYRALSILDNHPYHR